MRFLIAVIDDATATALPGEIERIDAFNDRLMANGQWVLACGLAAPAASTVIDNRGEQPLVTQGPHVASREYMAGFWVIEAADHATALALATEGSKCCNRKVEVRAFL